MKHSERKIGGLPVSILLLTVVIVITFVQKTESITPEQKDSISNGIEVGAKLCSIIKKRQFREAIKDLASKASKFLGALGPFVDFVLTFVPEEDTPELKLMKNMMNEIDTHFDRVDSRFDDVEQLVDWTEVAVNFGKIEQDIKAVDEEYKLFYKSDAPSAEKTFLFLSSYEENYSLSGTKLYQALTTQQGTFNEDLGESILRYTRNDRQKTEDFLLGILDLLLQAQRIELGYLEAKGFTTTRQERTTNWEERMQTLATKYEQIEETVISRYLSQSREDTIKYAADNSKLGKQDFANGLFDLLEQKYYWRGWMALVYDPITGDDNHRVEVLSGSGHTLFKQSGRNIVIASTDQLDVSYIHQLNANTVLNRFDVLEVFDLIPRYYLYYMRVKIDKKASVAFQKIPNQDYYNEKIYSVAVVQHSAGAYYKASPKTTAVKDLAPLFKIFMFA